MKISQQEYNQLLHGSSLLIEKQVPTGKKVIVTCKGLDKLETVCSQWFGFSEQFSSVLRLK